ncbi:MAG: hypothetical protein RL038_94 [Actinomycetota bacterium]
MTEPHVTWLSQAAFDSLVAELAEREGPIRTEITARIAEARAEGDLKENGGYHAAREEQGHNEGRINHLKALLENAKVGAPEVADGVAHIGRVVTIQFAPGDSETYYIGTATEAEFTKFEILSPGSPLGEAVIGRHIGDDIEYKLPNGRETTVTLIDVQKNETA